MSKTTESPARRQKLLSEIERLAEVAIFGTLSETYRTCGTPGCHCHKGGPKHGRTCISAIGESRGRPRATTCRKGRRKRREKE